MPAWNSFEYLFIRAYFDRGRNVLMWLLCDKCNESRSKSQQIYEQIIYLKLWLIKKAFDKIIVK